MTYNAIVARIKTRPFPNADRLLLGTCLGNQVVVGLDTQDGELGVFFNADGQLSEVFAKQHDLVAYTDSATGEKKGGFFAQNRRVRAQRFRGERSDGFWVPMSYFAFTGYDLTQLVEGMQFTELAGIPICNKFETAATRAAKNGPAKTKKKNIMFAEHIETEQLRHFIASIPAGSRLSFTEKCHGTSHRTGLVIDDLPLPLWKQRVNHLIRRNAFRRKRGWREVHGTRHVVIGDMSFDGYYGDAFRGKATAALHGQLRKGEVIYLEVVGWVNETTPIMNSQDITKMKDKTLEKRYGKTMTYRYGNLPGEQSIVVYRITQVNEDGHAVELSWAQVKARCRQLGVNHVPELYDAVVPVDGETAQTFIMQLADELAVGESTLDPSHIREGVVVRVEQPDGETRWYKHKSWEFKVLEGIAKEDETAVDMEEAS